LRRTKKELVLTGKVIPTAADVAPSAASSGFASRLAGDLGAEWGTNGGSPATLECAARRAATQATRAHRNWSFKTKASDAHTVPTSPAAPGELFELGLLRGCQHVLDPNEQRDLRFLDLLLDRENAVDLG
jgi:hypothetical protein